MVKDYDAGKHDGKKHGKHRVRFDVSSENGCTQVGHNVGWYISNNKYPY